MTDRRRVPIALLLALLLLASCGTTGEPSDAALDGSPAPESATEVAEGDDAEKAKEKEKKGSGKGGDSAKAGSPSGREGGSGGSGEGSGEGATTEGGSGGGEEGDGSRSGSGGSSPAGGGGTLYPTPGTYVYTQEGYEEFCSTGCERDRLPPRQRIASSVASRSADSVLVVTKARASGDRLVRTQTRYSDDAARVLEVHLEYSYEGFDFSRTYRPDPPVAALRFPLSQGRSWSGRWSGDVSGSYSVSVAGRETFGGSEVVRLATSTRFRGDIEGESHVTLWVDPRVGTVVRSAGNMTAEMGIGTYRTGFETTLASSP